jgi:hypothetical protein
MNVGTMITHGFTVGNGLKKQDNLAPILFNTLRPAAI